jgi:signal transduction histidine kinase
MLEDLDRLDRLINHMLDAARLDQRPVEQDLEDIEISALLERVAEFVRGQYRLPPEAIRVSAAPAVIRGRPLDIEILFRNLIDNAVKYSGERPEVLIESHLAGNRLLTRVTDNGPGIPISLRRKIFGRFVRLGNELERAQQGTGLGLFIVRNVVQRMRGTVNVRSRGSQQGTVFEVILPGKALSLRESAA